MKMEQIYRILKLAIGITAILLVVEVIFSIDAVNDFFIGIISSSNGIWVYMAVWLIMFLQVTVLNIPAWSVLVASAGMGIEILSWQFILTVITAYMCGCVLAYWLGRWFGVRAVKWCAGSQEDFEKWQSFLNTKGRVWYFLTVLFPFFPDDLLCLVCGATKFKFSFYFIANLIGRSVGLIVSILALKLLNSVGGGFPYMIIVWAVALVTEVITTIIIKNKLKTKGEK